MNKFILGSLITFGLVTGVNAMDNNIQAELQTGVKNGNGVMIAKGSFIDSADLGGTFIPYYASLEVATDGQFEVEVDTVVDVLDVWDYGVVALTGGVGIEGINRIGKTYTSTEEVAIGGDPTDTKLVETQVDQDDSKVANFYGQIGLSATFGDRTMPTYSKSVWIETFTYAKLGNESAAAGVDLRIPFDDKWSLVANGEYRVLHDTKGGSFERFSSTVTAGLNYRF